MSETPSVGIVGLGLIGGSIGLALRNPGRVILGCDVSAKAEDTALARQCIDRAGTLEEVSTCNVVFLCVPPKHVIPAAEQVYECSPECVATDCSSVKSEIAEWGRKRKRGSFVPGHPMAGHEKSGCEFSSSWLFRGAKWILTPNPGSVRSAVASVEELIKETGASPIRLKPESHDRHVAVLSHLPHAVAAALVLEADELEHQEVGAGSWRDLTRVAGVDPQLWAQIFYGNRAELSKTVDAFQERLKELKRALEGADQTDLEVWLTRARQAKARHAKTVEPPQRPAVKKRRH